MKTIDIILKAIGSLEAKVDGINSRLDSLNGSVKSHALRINDNEHKIDVNIGKVSVASAILGFIGACVIAFVGFLNR